MCVYLSLNNQPRIFFQTAWFEIGKLKDIFMVKVVMLLRYAMSGLCNYIGYHDIINKAYHNI